MNNELLERRHSLMEGLKEPAIDIIHPQWWHIKCYVNTENKTIMSVSAWGSMSIKEIISTPEEGTITVGSTNQGPCFKASKVGTYEFYATISHTGNMSVYYNYDCVYYVRLPKPYSSNSTLRPLYNYGPGGGTQHNKFEAYCINDNPPTGPNNTALGNLTNFTRLVIYIPKGTTQNYISNSNTRWNSLYTAGRLIEVNYNIIED